MGSLGREAQAAETRRVILDAARRLFEDGGYAATVVPSIAVAAGVAVKTVYLAFESQAGLLPAVWEARLGGDEEATPVLQRRWMRELTDETRPVEKLRLLAAQSRRVKTATGALLEVIRTAAATDSEIAALREEIQAKLLPARGRRPARRPRRAPAGTGGRGGGRRPVDPRSPERLAPPRPGTTVVARQTSSGSTKPAACSCSAPPRGGRT